jgi:hypothetical protein
LCIVSQSAEDFFSAGYGLTFILKDYDSVGANAEICELSINAADLLKQTGERTSYELEILQGVRASTDVFRPKLNLRIRKAKMEDKVFIKYLQAMGKKKSKLCGVYASASFVAPKAERVNFFKKEKKIADGVKHVSSTKGIMTMDIMMMILAIFGIQYLIQSFFIPISWIVSSQATPGSDAR